MNAVAVNFDQTPNYWSRREYMPAGGHPLSLLQRTLWRSGPTEPQAGGANNLAFRATVLGGIDSPRLAEALNALATRHPILRARIQERHGEPVHVMDSGAGVPLACVDATALGASPFEALLRQECLRPFDRSVAPLLRAGLYRKSGDESVLLLVADRILIDSWSFGTLIRELGELVGAADKCAPWVSHWAPDLPTYFGYVNWERDWLGSDEAAGQLAYWRTALGEPCPRLNLGGREPSRRDDGADRDILAFSLAGDLVRGLRAFADSSGTTLHAALLAAYLASLGRSAGEARVAAGTPVSLRNGGEWDGTIGNLENLAAIGAEFHAGLTLGDLARTVAESLAAAGRHHAYPFAELAARLNPEPGDQPYFQTLFVLHQPLGDLDVLGLAGCEPDGRTVRWGGLDLDPHSLAYHGGRSDFGLVLDVVEVGDSISGTFTFATASFERGAVARLCGDWRTLLETMVADPAAPVDGRTPADAGERPPMTERPGYATWAEIARGHSSRARADWSPGRMAIVGEEWREGHA